LLQIVTEISRRGDSIRKNRPDIPVAGTESVVYARVQA
jgi:hypothetical protein